VASGRPWFAWVVVLLFAAVYAPTVAWLWERWTLSVWHNVHGALIPPLVAYFCWVELSEHRDLPVSSSAWGFAFLVPALALHVLDTGMHTQLLSAASIVLAIPGLSLLLLGAPRTRAMAFPLALLAFALPIPLALTARLHLVLRHVATFFTANIVPWLGMPVYAEGTTLHMSNGVIEIADACSGFSTLYAAVATAVLCAYATPSWRRRVLVLALAAPIAIAANVLRVILLVVMVRTQGFEVLHTWQHPATGILTFVLALPLIFWLSTPKASPRAGEA
jgi:exosortase